MTNLTTEQFYYGKCEVDNLTEVIPSIQELMQTAVINYQKTFECYPEISGVAPGKIVILGEHTKNLEGATISMAIPMATIAIGKKMSKSELTILTSADVPEPKCFTVSAHLRKLQKTIFPNWLQRVKNILLQYLHEYGKIPGFNMMIESSIPIDNGFGSGIALETAVIKFLECLIGPGHNFNREQYTGKHLGDTLEDVERITHVIPEERCAIMVDYCRNEWEYVPMIEQDYVFLLISAKDNLTSSVNFRKINKYVSKASEMLGIQSIREGTAESILELQDKVTEICKNYVSVDNSAQSENGEADEVWTLETYMEMIKVASYFVSETNRVTSASECCKNNQTKELGQILVESQNSFNEAFKISSSLVDFCFKVSANQSGIFGVKGLWSDTGALNAVLILVDQGMVSKYVEMIKISFRQWQNNGFSIEDENETNLLEGEDMREEASVTALSPPSIYQFFPFQGAKLVIFTMAGFLRCPMACNTYDPKYIVRRCVKSFESIHGKTPEVAGIAPVNILLFGEFLNEHCACTISFSLPMFAVVVGSKNNSVYFKWSGIKKQSTVEIPIPSVRNIDLLDQDLTGEIKSSIYSYKGCVPGVDTVVKSCIPKKLGFDRAAAIQGAVHAFLYRLSNLSNCKKIKESQPISSQIPVGREMKFANLTQSPASDIDGYVFHTDMKKSKITPHRLDHAEYVFLLAIKKVENEVNLNDLRERKNITKSAAILLGRETLRDVKEEHLICLIRRGASDVMLSRVKYIISEIRRVAEAVEAIKQQNFPKLGALLTESHRSLSEEYEVTCQEVDEMVDLALEAEGVLGAKMIGNGLYGTVLILLPLLAVNNCISLMKNHYESPKQAPKFHVVKPTTSAFSMDNHEWNYIGLP